MSKHDDSIAWEKQSKPPQKPVDIDVRRTPDGTLIVSVKSICSACHGGTVRRVRKVAPSGHKGHRGDSLEEKRPALPAELREITFLCDCGYTHSQRPEGDYGCGRYWRVVLHESRS